MCFCHDTRGIWKYNILGWLMPCWSCGSDHSGWAPDLVNDTCKWQHCVLWAAHSKLCSPFITRNELGMKRQLTICFLAFCICFVFIENKSTHWQENGMCKEIRSAFISMWLVQEIRQPGIYADFYRDFYLFALYSTLTTAFS